MASLKLSTNDDGGNIIYDEDRKCNIKPFTNNFGLKNTDNGFAAIKGGLCDDWDNAQTKS